MAKKNVEIQCLDIVRTVKKIPDLQGKVKNTERPDFIIGDIGIEHFLADVLLNNGSVARRMKADIKERGNGNESYFSYNAFIHNFKRVYKKHYQNIPVYRQKCNKLGFLIELPYLENFREHPFTIIKDGEKQIQKMQNVPISKDMISCFKWKDNADFVILCFRPCLKEDYSQCHVMWIDLTDIENLEEQGVLICDEFHY